MHTWRVWADHPQISGVIVQSAGQLLARKLSVPLGCGPTLAGVRVRGPAWTRRWTRALYTEGLAVSPWEGVDSYRGFDLRSAPCVHFPPNVLDIEGQTDIRIVKKENKHVTTP